MRACKLKRFATVTGADRLVSMRLQEIAKELFVSNTTVKTHVSHILTKLGVRDRVQAVVEAYESGIVIPGN